MASSSSKKVESEWKLPIRRLYVFSLLTRRLLQPFCLHPFASLFSQGLCKTWKITRCRKTFLCICYTFAYFINNLCPPLQKFPLLFFISVFFSHGVLSIMHRIVYPYTANTRLMYSAFFSTLIFYFIGLRVFFHYLVKSIFNKVPIRWRSAGTRFCKLAREKAKSTNQQELHVIFWIIGI